MLSLLWAAPLWAQDSPEVSDAQVEAGLDRATDRKVAERLKATFETIESLRGVSVEVEAGVVRLEGEVDSTSARELAGALAQQVAGVTAVDNAVEQTRSVQRRLEIAVDRLVERGWDLLGALPLLIVALLIFCASLFFARVVGSGDFLFRWVTDNVFLRDLARQIVRITIALVGVLLALEILDATALVGAVLGAAGVAGLAVGFAFRDLVENYIASILLSVRQPFAPRDLVRIGDHLGCVARLTSRATVLVTSDGNHVRIPNGVVFKSTIENFTKKPQRRFSVAVGVGVEEDLVTAQDVGNQVLVSMEGVLDDPPPFCRIEELGDSSVTLQFFGWVDQREADFGKVRSEAVRLVKQAFDRRGIEMPEPIHRVRIENMAADTGADERRDDGATDRVRDVAPDRHLEELVEEERASDDADLLSEQGLPE